MLLSSRVTSTENFMKFGRLVFEICEQGAQQQTRRPPLLLTIDETDRRTDGRTLDRYTDPAPHTMRVVSIKYITRRQKLMDRISRGPPIYWPLRVTPTAVGCSYL